MKKGFFYFVLSKICATFAVDLQNREVAQLVSVRVWGARGRQFESGLPDHKQEWQTSFLLDFIEVEPES